jgi:hypothetical protein
VSDLAPVKSAAVAADVFAVGSLVAVGSSQFFSPRHFFLYRLKSLRGNNGFMRSLHIILWNLAVINTEFFCQEVGRKRFCNNSDIDRKVLSQLVDAIYVDGEKNISVNFKFRDEIRQYFAALDD